MIFVDTSAIYALADRNDPRHNQAREQLQRILNASEDLLTHNYVLLEALALIQNRLGRAAALQTATDCRAFQIEWVAEGPHYEALHRLARRGDRHVSLVDQASFLVLRRRGIRTALAYDPDFEQEGFRLFD